jgi:hypothetical protein
MHASILYLFISQSNGTPECLSSREKQYRRMKKDGYFIPSEGFRLASFFFQQKKYNALSHTFPSQCFHTKA